MKYRLSIVALLVASFASACSDAPVPTLAPTDRAALLQNDHPQKYVALGTSISMGWQSDGVYYAGQLVSFPSQLAIGNGRPITLPLIQAPGCVSPLIAPLAAGKRLSGESAAGSTVCAPNVERVTLPTQNVGIAGALAADALTTPSPGPVTAPWYKRVLPPGATQLSAALVQQPTVVSVEFGGNEVLGALSGLYAPGVTVVPFPFFAGPYSALLDAIGTTHAKAVLFEMPATATKFPALRRAEEIWADRFEFAALHVDVSTDCRNSPNYINVSIKSLNAAYDGAFRAAHGLPNTTFSCADIPGTQDLVLTPADIANANALLAQMRAFVEAQAAARGYALASLGALYDRSDLKPRPYSIINHLTSPIPMGLYISLDGVHPSALGHGLLALEAARALNATYGASFAKAATATSTLALTGDINDVSPSIALEMAKSVAAENRGVQLSPCFLGACRVVVPRR
jgi:lysophospholipase L1-like esterase